MQPSGFNPMRWHCELDGCFNIKRRPKIEVFADCFPRRINFGDVDGLVEIGGVFCLLEWKGEGGSIKHGQRLSYTAFTALPGNIVFIIDGDAETMLVKRYCIFWAGRQHAWIDAALDDVKTRMRGWVSHAEARKVAA